MWMDCFRCCWPQWAGGCRGLWLCQGCIFPTAPCSGVRACFPVCSHIPFLKCFSSAIEVAQSTSWMPLVTALTASGDEQQASKQGQLSLSVILLLINYLGANPKSHQSPWQCSCQPGVSPLSAEASSVIWTGSILSLKPPKLYFHAFFCYNWSIIAEGLCM